MQIVVVLRCEEIEIVADEVKHEPIGLDTFFHYNGCVVLCFSVRNLGDARCGRRRREVNDTLLLIDLPDGLRSRRHLNGVFFFNAVVPAVNAVGIVCERTFCVSERNESGGCDRVEVLFGAFHVACLCHKQTVGHAGAVERVGLGVVQSAIAVGFDVQIQNIVFEHVELIVDGIDAFGNESCSRCKHLLTASVCFDCAKLVVVFIAIFARCGLDVIDCVSIVAPNNVFDFFDESAFDCAFTFVGGFVVHARKIDIADCVVRVVENSGRREEIFCRASADCADKLRHRTVCFGAHKVGVDGRRRAGFILCGVDGGIVNPVAVDCDSADV